MSDTPRIEPVDAGLILENEQNNYMRLAHASKRIETELAKALDEIKGLRQLVNDCHVIAGQLETERNEAQAEIERKNKLIEQMAGALNHCKSTFEDYVKIHKAKMPVVTIGPIPPEWGDMQRKIARNQEAFDLCNAALSAAERGE